jgi:hypothetical protein
MTQNEKGLLENQQLIAVENDLKTMTVKGARKIAKDRDSWKLILKEAGVLHEL